ncbi:MAG: diguanylate cyclase [Deltaproteobacteria bacterium]|nr:diguanylate cyclase [Deltaproteobacteria bacterium]
MGEAWSRQLVRAVPATSVGVAFLRFLGGGFRCLQGLDLADAVVVVLLLSGVGLSAWRRLSREGEPTAREEVELGAGLLASAYVVVCVGGAALWPIVCLLMASLVAFSGRTAGFVLLAVALSFDGISTLAQPAGGVSAFAAHAAFLALFSALYHLVLSARLVLARKAETDAVKNRLREVEERARSFRLVNSGVSPRAAGEKEEEKWLLASVKEVERAVGAALEIAELTLRTQTCAAYLLSEDGRHLRMQDCRSGVDRVCREPLAAGEGVLAGVLKSGAPLRLQGRSLRIPWYEADGSQPSSALLVPIREPSGGVRGVLVADRAEEKAFSPEDERVLTAVAGEVSRAIEGERVMALIRKGKDEKDRFYRALEEMNRAGSPDEVFHAVLEGVRQLAPVDFLAVTLVSEEDGKRAHKVVRTSGVTPGGRALVGRSFADNTGLVSNVVRYGAALPGRDVRDMDRQVIFDEESEIRGLAGLKIFPLLASDRILGTLVAGSRRRGVLDPDVLRMLEVMALQAGQAVLRAQLFEQMERMATTDGLTGLLNHRTFQQRADDILAHSRRYGRRASLILTDIDHFKSVNDTHGHPMGDQVLKGVARVVREQARDTDVVARYGGEEFAIVMPETDARGALIIAERIRQAVMAQVFQTDSGPLKVTLSLGIATTPDHAADKQGLVDLADQCLYFAKRHGRNQAVTVDRMQAGNGALHAAG